MFIFAAMTIGKYPKIRCVSCGKVLMEGVIKDGIVVKKCRCGIINTISAEKPKSAGQEESHRSTSQ